MGEKAMREPLSADERFWLWFWLIVSTGFVLVIAILVGGGTYYYSSLTPEQKCADWRDPPEFCRELAKRPRP